MRLVEIILYTAGVLVLAILCAHGIALIVDNAARAQVTVSSDFPVRYPLAADLFCTAHPTECAPAKSAVPIEASPANLYAIAAINDWVNGEIEQIDDAPHFGSVDVWTFPTDGKGDCEDIALEKRRRLIEAGYPRSALSLAYVLANGIGHAVLVVRTDAGPLVLDNLEKRVLPPRDTALNFIALQSPTNPRQWVRP